MPPHGQQGAFLAAVQRRCAGENGGRFADEFCTEPKGNGAVDKVFHRGSHIAEPRRAAERKAGAIFEVVGSRVWRTFVRNGFFNGFANGGNFGNGTQHGFATVHAFDTACDSGDLGSFGVSVTMLSGFRRPFKYSGRLKRKNFNLKEGKGYAVFAMVARFFKE